MEIMNQKTERPHTLKEYRRESDLCPKETACYFSMVFQGEKQQNIVDVIYSRTRFRAWRQATSVN